MKRGPLRTLDLRNEGEVQVDSEGTGTEQRGSGYRPNPGSATEVGAEEAPVPVASVPSVLRQGMSQL